jgi:hypothetical protein
MHLPCRCVADQPALFDRFAVGVHGRDGIARRQRNNLLGPAGQERIAPDKKRASAPFAHGSERGVDLARRTGIEH